MPKSSHKPGSLESKIFLMFGVLVAFIILNGIHSSYRWNISTTQKIEEDLSNKLTIAHSVLSNELDKFNDLSFIVREQKTQILELMDFDDYRAINILLQRVSSLYDVDLLLLLDDQDALLSSNKFVTEQFSKTAHLSLLNNLDKTSALEVVSHELFQFKFAEYSKQSQDIPYICFKSVIKLVYDSGDTGGYIVMLKLLNVRADLLRKMAELSGAKVFIYDEHMNPILSGFNQSELQGFSEKNNTITIDNEHFLVKQQVLPIVSDNKHTVKLAVAIDTDIYEQQRNQLLLSNLFPFVVTVGVSIFLFFFLKIRIFNKVTELIHTLREVTAGNLEMRLKNPQKNNVQADEMTNMGLNFNIMMERMQESYNQLDHNSRELGALNSQLKDEIIDRKNTEIALLEAKQEAEAANQSKSLFLANMSHEIRTPMNAILGYAQILQRESTLSDEQRESIHTIHRSGIHLLDLINDILDISKIEAGRMELKCDDFDLSGLLSDLSEMFKLRCTEKSLRWQMDVPSQPERIVVHGDEGKLKQVLINLLGNAVKFTESGRVVMSLTIKPEHCYLFEVIDSGQGIPESAQQDIFRAFQQDEQGFKKGGTGLGLAIASKQIELMKSQLQLESQIGHGARFYFELYLPPPQSEHIAKSTKVRTIAHLKAGYHATAWVVDDVQVNRDVLSSILVQIGVTVEQAEDGVHALEKLKVSQPDIIFMDYRMPRMDGIEAVKNIKALFNDRIKLVMVSASVFDTADRFIHAGCDSMINKPFRLEEVYDCLQDLLNIEYVYVEDNATATIVANDTSDKTLNDFTSIQLATNLYQKLKESAEFCILTDLEEAVVELSKLGEQEAQLAAYLTPFINNYDMDSILSTLEGMPHD